MAIAPFEILFAELAAEVAARTGLSGRELRAATYDDIAAQCEETERGKPPGTYTPGLIPFSYREMARQVRAGELHADAL
ncbi:MAG: hypothetical protein JWR80_6524 [Bradyrhizobium sp.]|nr:hypothetical protein [Bradyrhizobium sp.]